MILHREWGAPTRSPRTKLTDISLRDWITKLFTGVIGSLLVIDG